MITKKDLMAEGAERQGFTLIEILIVVAIIAILASVVMVGLGPTQQLGRDARRVSDLHEVQTGLELYYNAKGQYPVVTGGSWATLQSTLMGASINVNTVPNDPTNGKSYQYGTDTNGTTYILGANLESGNSSVWQTYQGAPANLGSMNSGDSSLTGDCKGPKLGGSTDLNYCLSI